MPSFRITSMELNLRVIQLSNAPKAEMFRNTRILHVSTYKSNLSMEIPMTGLDILTADKTWTVPVVQDPSEMIVLTLIEPKLNKRAIAQISIPIYWFPERVLIRDQFPMTSLVPDQPVPVITLDVHIAKKGSKPFVAPAGPLSIVPGWKSQGVCFTLPPNNPFLGYPDANM